MIYHKAIWKRDLYTEDLAKAVFESLNDVGDVDPNVAKNLQVPYAGGFGCHEDAEVDDPAHTKSGEAVIRRKPYDKGVGLHLNLLVITVTIKSATEIEHLNLPSTSFWELFKPSLNYLFVRCVPLDFKMYKSGKKNILIYEPNYLGDEAQAPMTQSMAGMEAARLRLEAILKDAEAAGLTRSEAVRLASARRPKSWRLKFLHLAALIAVLAIVMKGKLYTVEGVTNAWMWYYGRHPTADRCAVWMPDIAYHAFRPPVDCSVCRDVHNIDRVHNITPADFEQKYAFSARPVIISDAMKNWTAPSIFSFNFFRELYAGSKAQDRCQFFPYKTNFRYLWQVLEMPEERAQLIGDQEPWYVGWSNCDEEVGQILRQHYSRPYFLPANSENKNTDWIFMGSPGYGAHMHVDNVNNPSWQAQLVGSKNWTLQPPPECIYECMSHQVTINQGEIFVLDTNIWYHSTIIVSDGISITIGAEYD